MTTIAAEYDLDVCPACLIAGYGFDSPEAWEMLLPDDPDPLSLLPLYVDHPDWVITDRDDEPEPFYSILPCGLCGQRLHGDRYPVVLTEFDPPATLSEFAING